MEIGTFKKEDIEIKVPIAEFKKMFNIDDKHATVKVILEDNIVTISYCKSSSIDWEKR